MVLDNRLLWWCLDIRFLWWCWILGFYGSARYQLVILLLDVWLLRWWRILGCYVTLLPLKGPIAGRQNSRYLNSIFQHPASIIFFSACFMFVSYLVIFIHGANPQVLFSGVPFYSCQVSSLVSVDWDIECHLLMIKTFYFQFILLCLVPFDPCWSLI